MLIGRGTEFCRGLGDGLAQKITFAELPSQGMRGLLVYCQDYRCSHNVRISGDRWADDLRLSDIEDRFICTACGKRGAEVRGDS